MQPSAIGTEARSSELPPTPGYGAASGAREEGVEQTTEDGGQRTEVTGHPPTPGYGAESGVREEKPKGAKTARIVFEQEVADEAIRSTVRRPWLSRVAEADWAPGLLIFLCDVVCWFLLYASLAFLRRDAFYTSAFELLIIDGLQLLIIVQCLFIIGGYNPRTDMRSLGYTAEHIIAMFAALTISAVAIYAAAAFDHVMRPARSAVLVSFIAFTPISLFYRRLLSGRVAKASANRAFLVIGAGQIAANFYKTYRQAGNQQRLEFVDAENQRVGQRIAGPTSPLIEGDLASKLNQAARRYSGIILAEGLGHIGSDVLERLIRTQFHRTRVYTLESFYEEQWKRVPVHAVDPFWPLQSGFQQLARTSPYHYVKRLFDIVASTVLLIVTFPLMLLIAALIRLTDGWPVIFQQERVGRDDQLFIMYKFRTMVHAGAVAEARSSELEARGAGGQTSQSEGQTSDVRGQMSDDEIYTRAGDPRVSRLGRWLRKWRLDELPQLWNVFKGELSLIGPRAEWVECANRYRKKIPFYHFRHLVKPGITGWAQVNYPYGESDEDAVEKLKYDLYYIRHYSLTLDAMIVLKTVYTMLFGKGR